MNSNILLKELCRKGAEILNSKSMLVQEAANELIEMLLDVGEDQIAPKGCLFSKVYLITLCLQDALDYNISQNETLKFCLS